VTGVEPLPFRIRLPDEDEWGFTGFQQTEYRITGLLHFTPDALYLEWVERRKIERFTLGDVGTVHEEFPVETLEIPIDWVASLEVAGGWWLPRVRLRARRLDAFEGIPGAEPGRLMLVIARRDRALATAFAAALEGRVPDLAGARPEPTRRLPPFTPTAG
jgi:hypothetical protein